MMNFHNGKSPFMYIVACVSLCLGGSTNAMAAEIWLESNAIMPGQMIRGDASSCRIVTNDCEVCITPLGKGEAVCSRRSEECSPTKWYCLEAAGAAPPWMGQHLLRKSHVQSVRRVSSTGSKIFFDRVQPVETFEAEYTARGVIEQTQPLQITPPSTKEFQDRLDSAN